MSKSVFYWGGFFDTIYMKCVEHGVPFPKGAVCPKCDYNNNKKEEEDVY